MSRDDDNFEGPVKERSGWLIPLAVFVVTAALSALFLIYYLAPRPPSLSEERPSPTDAADIVEVSVGGAKFRIPANYMQFASARKGGKQTQVALHALLPDLHGYNRAEAEAFSRNTPDSEVVYLLIREERVNLSEADRFRRIYLAYVVDPQGQEGPFGLTQYTFRDDSGYRGEDLFVAEPAAGSMVLRCARFGPNSPNPSCLRDIPLGDGVALTYRFRRAHLAQWADIEDGVRRLVHSFEARED